MKIDINQINEKFEKAAPQEILSWAVKTYSPKAALSSSFGAQSAVLLHMATQIDPRIPILFIDTGFLFKETYAFAEELTRRFKLNLKTFRPSEEALADSRERLKTNRFACCDKTKVECMERALKGVECWMAGLRRGQSESRKNVKIVEEYRSGLVKVHPIANWTSQDVQEYMKKYDLPYHPLWEKGYTSIGCEPSTTKPLAGQDERSGRWAGSDKTECGIHTFLKEEKK